jgi:dihydroorotate dehydrogenase (NAD+) catalytic subunit
MVTPHRARQPYAAPGGLSCGAINSIGLENVGFAAFVGEVLPELEARGVPTVVSLAATRPDEFGRMCGELYRAGRGCAHFHGVELNLSCPNIAEGGHDFGSTRTCACRRRERAARSRAHRRSRRT